MHILILDTLNSLSKSTYDYIHIIYYRGILKYAARVHNWSQGFWVNCMLICRRTLSSHHTQRTGHHVDFAHGHSVTLPPLATSAVLPQSHCDPMPSTARSPDAIQSGAAVDASAVWHHWAAPNALGSGTARPLQRQLSAHPSESRARQCCTRKYRNDALPVHHGHVGSGFLGPHRIEAAKDSLLA